MAKTAFNSHASPDAAIARTVTAHLERQAVSCWIAPRDVLAGADYGSEIIDGIESSAVFVLVLSAQANASRFVKREVERAVSKGKPVFTLRIENVLPARPRVERWRSAAGLLVEGDIDGRTRGDTSGFGGHGGQVGHGVGRSSTAAARTTQDGVFGG